MLLVGWLVAAPRTSRPSAPLNIVPLTSFGDVIDAIISPDARYVAFVRSSQGRQSLWIRQLRGTNAIQVVGPEAVSFYGMSFAPDSSSIYYVVRGPEPLARPAGMLFQIPALGGAPRRLGTPLDHYPVVSPDGTAIASLRADYPASGQSALVTVAADGSGMRTVMAVSPPEMLAPGFFVAPAWSPAGDRLAAAVRNTDTGTAHLVTVDVATGAAHRLTTAFASASFASWMPDGSGIVFTGATQREDDGRIRIRLVVSATARRTAAADHDGSHRIPQCDDLRGRDVAGQRRQLAERGALAPAARRRSARADSLAEGGRHRRPGVARREDHCVHVVRRRHGADLDDGHRRGGPASADDRRIEWLAASNRGRPDDLLRHESQWTRSDLAHGSDRAPGSVSSPRRRSRGISRCRPTSDRCSSPARVSIASTPRGRCPPTAESRRCS